MKKRFSSKALSLVLCVALIFTYLPILTSAAGTPDPVRYAADASTYDSWQELFTPNSTVNAGTVWTDKSVMTNTTIPTEAGVSVADDAFLVALSVLASNMAIEGLSSSPTDTIFVLDTSGSMDGNGDELVDATNESIRTLLAANKYNRVGIILYSGGSGSGGSAATLLPLDRYTTTDSNGDFIQVTRNNETIRVLSSVRNESNTSFSSTSRSITGGTFIQDGILAAMNVFTASSNTTTVNDPVLGTLTRKPIMVLMSDGMPTFASVNFTTGDEKLGDGSEGQGEDHEAFAFMTQLTAAYAKAEMKAKYGSEPLFYTLGLGTTGNTYATSVLDPTQSTNTINNWWSDYNNLSVSEQMLITVRIWNGWFPSDRAYNITKSSVAMAQNYADGAFAADDAAGLATAFEQIVSDITLQSEYYPTLIRDSEDLSGYVSFVDKIGMHMNVTDIKGIYIGETTGGTRTLFTGAELAKHIDNYMKTGDGEEGYYKMLDALSVRLGIDNLPLADALIRNAYRDGQVSYVSDTEFSNFVGWYANAKGEILGYYQPGVTTLPTTDASTPEDEVPVYIIRSYGYLGAVDEAHGVSESDMTYATVQWRYNLTTGEEMITFAVPAALIPTVTYTVKLDDNNELTGLEYNEALPIRLLYEVALDPAINEFTLKDIVSESYMSDPHNVNSDGSVNFYTNAWDHSNVTGYGTVNTYSYFNPSRGNERYYYLEDTPVYVHDGTDYVYYNGSTQPSASGTFYRPITVYTKNGSSYAIETVYRELSNDAKATAVAGAGGTWYIPKGNVHVNLDGYEKTKASNETGTIDSSYVPFVDATYHSVDDTGYNFYVGATHGNNGIISISPATGFSLTKTLAAGATETSDEFTFVIENTSDPSDNSTYPAYYVNADGTVNDTVTEVAFSAGKATVTLKPGDTISFDDMDAGHVFTITETETVDYVVGSVSGATYVGNVATVTVTANTLTKVSFTNEDRGTGDLTVMKVIEHPFAFSYAIPTDLTFNFTLTLSGVGTANATFSATKTGSAITSITTDQNGVYTFTLAHNEQLEIFDLPAGVTATVVENAPVTGSGFNTPVYFDNGAAGDGIVTTVKDGVVSVIVRNDYDPQGITGPDITVNATKILTGREWFDTDEFRFRLQRYDTSISDWVQIGSEVVATKANQTVSFNGAFAGEVYSEIGEYYYRVVEIEPADPIEGITYDKTVHSFYVAVTDLDMDGRLEVNTVSTQRPETVHITNDSGAYTVAVDFNNSYSVDDVVTVTIDMTKLLTNESGSARALLSGYQFGLFEDGATTPILTSAPTNERGFARFVLYYNETHANVTNPSYKVTYTLKELVPATPDPHITYSTQEYKVTVEVNYNSSTGKLEAVVYTAAERPANASAETAVTFTNVYDPADATLAFNFINKTLNGRPMNAGEFSFAIYEYGVETPLKTATNAADGTIDFGSITYSKVGRYFYNVRETSVNANGVTVDGTTFRITVDVSDVNGQLTAVYTIDNVAGNTATFVNNYTPAPTSITVSGNKVLSGRPLLNDEFTFTLVSSDASGNPTGTPVSVRNDVNGKFTFPSITFTKTGTYYYLITETAGSLKGVSYDASRILVTVVVNDNLEGSLYVVSGYPTYTVIGGSAMTSLSFTNTYTPAGTSLVLNGNKYLLDENNEYLDIEAGQFSFALYQASNTYSYDANSPIATVLNYIETVHFTNANGDPDQANVGRFKFENLDELEFTAAGDYYFVIKEVNGGKVIDGITYDNETYRVHVRVIDDKMGSLYTEYRITDSEGIYSSVNFVNRYAAVGEADLVLTGLKTLTGRNIRDGEFSFQLLEGSTVLQTVTNVGANITFEPLKYTHEDLKVEGVYLNKVVKTYTVKEVQNGLGGVTYDATVYIVTVTITDNDAGGINLAHTIRIEDTEEYVSHVDFTNEYDTTDANVIFRGEKTLTGRDINAGEFTFELIQTTARFNPEAGTLIGTATHGAASGSVGFAFAPYTFNDAGTYYFVIREVHGTLGGVTYDNSLYRVTVQVTDDGHGKLVVGTPTYQRVYANGTTAAASSVVFENSYTPASTTAQLSADKVLEGKALEGGVFAFTLYSSDASFATGAAIETVKNGADGSVDFAAIDYTSVGSNYYVIKENIGNSGGITYDETKYGAIVTVTDYGHGQLHSAVEYFRIDENGNAVELPNGIVIVNTYTVEGDVTVTLGGLKTLNGRDLNDGEFSANLLEGDTVIHTAKIGKTDANKGTYSITLTYDETDIGTHTYTLVEKNNALGGVTYDDTEYAVKVVISDNGAGGIKADVTVNGAAYEQDNSLNFTNSYTYQNTSVTIGGEKVLDGIRDIENGEFTFELYLADASFNYGADLIDSANNIGNTFKFAQIEYDAPGTYRYVVVEKTGDKGGVIYDTAEYAVTVTVIDNGVGQLVVSSVVNELIGGTGGNTPIVFENEYVTVPATATIAGDKTIENKNIADWVFSFELYESNDVWALDLNALVEKVNNDTNGKFAFSQLTFGTVGTYYYLVREEKGTAGGITYDINVYRVKIDVTDNKLGQLDAKVTYMDANGDPITAITFNNVYTFGGSDTVEFGGTKTLTGRAIKAGEFVFELYKDKIEGSPLRTVTNGADGKFEFTLDYTSADIGTHNYIVVEQSNGLGGITYSTAKYYVTVNVEDDNKGGIVASYAMSNGTTAVDSLDFENSYSAKAAEVSFGGIKTLEGKTLQDGEFTFNLYASDAEYKYEGRPIDTVKNGADGKFGFGAISYNKAGTYYYVIVEDASAAQGGITYDNARYGVKVVVTDDGKGQLVAERAYTLIGGTEVGDIRFENLYNAKPVDVVINGDKTLTGKDIANYEFIFELYGTNANGDVSKLIESVKNGKDGKFSFSALNFANVGTYYFFVKEANSGIGGIVYDETVYDIVITVTDDYKGQLHATVAVTNAATDDAAEGIVFNNKYEITGSADITVGGNKFLEGKELQADEFTFNLFAADAEYKYTGTPIDSVKNGKDGSFTFDKLVFTEPGVHYYVIVEDASAAQGGITYDKTVYGVKITVSDNGVGGLSLLDEYVIVTGGTFGSIVFNNAYKANPAGIVISGDKTLTGKDIADYEFMFELYKADANGDASTLIESVKNGKDGKFSFSAFSLTEVGTYHYLVKERVGNSGGIVYDDTVYSVVITVTDDLLGQLHATVVVTNEATGAAVGGIVFNNKYEITGSADITVGGNKFLEGKELQDDEFTFNLYAADAYYEYKGNPIDSVKNGKDGAFTFDKLVFTEPGVHHYVIVEDASAAQGGITYDKTIYGVKITVSDNGVGGLSLLDEYVIVTGGTFGSIVFNNAYKAAATEAQLGGIKQLVGKTLEEGMFSFMLYASDADYNVGAAIETVKNGADGSIVFTAIEYTEAGSYYYVIKEDGGDRGGIVYDETVYNVRVDVTDDLLGKLHADVVILDAEANELDGIEFVNNYVITENAKVDIAGTKYLNGAKLEADAFAFNIFLADEAFSIVGDAFETVRNDVYGAFSFFTIEYDEAGVYRYVIKEDTSVFTEGMTYDERAYSVVVTVTDNGEGKLVAEVDYFNGSTEVDEIVFVNEYTEPTPPTPPTADDKNLWIALILIISTLAVGHSLRKKRAN